MKISRIGLALACSLGFAGVATAASPQYVPNQVVVKFRPYATSTRALAHATIGAVATREISQLGLQTITLPKGMTVDRALQYYRTRSDVEYVEPNYIGHMTYMPNDPMYNKQYANPRLAMPQAWDLSLGNSNIKIAIVDTGVDYTHPDLSGKVILGKDFYNNDDDPMDDQGHGTHCAGDAAAKTNNGIGVASTGFNCTIIAEKASDKNGSFPNDAFVAAILDASNRGADVISMSVGFGARIQSQEDAVNLAWSKGAVLVAAAGNSNTTVKSWPGAFDKCIGVGASDSNDARADFSNFGADWVDVAAPGVDIVSTTMGGGYEAFSGTSMATPIVAGLVGLMKSYVPTATNVELRTALEATCDNIGTWIAKGRVNGFRAIGNIVKPVLKDFPAKSASIYAEAGFVQGASLTGTVANLTKADGAVVNVSSVQQPNVARISSVMSSLTVVQDVSKIRSTTLQVSAKSTSGVTLQVFAKNYNTGKYELLQSNPANGSMNTYNVAVKNLAPYVLGTTMSIVVRGYVSVTRTPAIHTLSVDQLNLHIVSNP